MGIVPAQQDAGEQVGITADGHRREKVPRYDLAAPCEASGLDLLLRALDDMGQIEEDTAHSRMHLQDRDQEGAVSASHIDNRAEL